MITTKHTQESLSRSYIYAIAGSAGVNLQMERAFDYGIDGTFRSVVIRGNRRIESGYPVDFQLKCTKNWNYEGDNVSYSLETKTYNDLVTREREGIGAVLILLCVPETPDDWLEVCEEYTRLRRCCYYASLSGAPVENVESTRKILIPRANLLTAGSLNGLLAAERARKVNGSSE
jgi:hypothetical protein